MNFPKKKIILLFLSILILSSAWSQEFPSLEPLVTVLTTDYTGTLNSDDLIRSSIIFSIARNNTDSEEYYFVKYKNLEQRFLNSCQGLSPDQKAEYALEFLYQEKLIQYKEDQTLITELFDSGTYNCVSASIMYMALAKACNLNVKAQLTKTHCFITYYSESGTAIDVETTNPYGFNPGTKHFESSTKYAVVPAVKYSGRKEISDRNLSSLVAKNMCSMYDEQGFNQLAIQMAAARMEYLYFDATENDARSDFDLVCKNYIAKLEQTQQYYDSILFIKQIEEQYGLSENLKEVFDREFYNCIATLCMAEDFSTAESFFDQYKNQVSLNTQEKLETIMFVKKAEYELDFLSNLDAVEYIKNLFTQQVGQKRDVKKQLESWLEYYWLLELNNYFTAQNYLECYNLCQVALNDIPSNSNINRLLKQSIYNYDVQIHNQFAVYVNSGEYEKAQEVLQEGLSNHGDSSILIKDKTFIDEILSK